MATEMTEHQRAYRSALAIARRTQQPALIWRGLAPYHHVYTATQGKSRSAMLRGNWEFVEEVPVPLCKEAK